jgi:drug/metabolite transporter (DMT)-like permease
MNALLAWYFVAIWGVGYIATKIGLQHAPPFTFLALRFALGLLCLAPVVLFLRVRWPATAPEWGHLAVAGLLMHAVQLGGTHYAQYLGMSAGVVAIILASQPLVTAAFLAGFLRERILFGQWLGIALGLCGVALVVWHKIDVREVTLGSLAGTLVGLAGITAATLYQKRFSPKADLKAAAVIQFAATLALVAPLALAVEGFAFTPSWALLGAIAFLVILASILGVSAFNFLMRRGESARVTSIMYLPPVFAVVAELAVFRIVPTPLTVAGMVVTCLGVAMTVWTPRWTSSTS